MKYILSMLFCVFATVVFQKPAKTFPADDFTRTLRRRFDDLIVETLMRSFGVIVFDVFMNKIF